ncbi:MAG: OmpA family protein [Bacteroidota bacterium]
MTTRFSICTVILSFLFLYDLAAQEATIELINPSFEGFPRAELVPTGWKDCGFPGESAPDTHPIGAFDVVKLPSDGNTYLGMVVRDNDTWERVSQQLKSPVKGGICYSFNMNLCRSELYVSRSRVSNTNANYVTPIKLVIWGGDGHCSKRERLAESPIVTNTAWQPYAFKFEPKQTHTHITVEALYKTPVLFPYNGNILLDKASAIVPIPCDEEPMLAQIPEAYFTNPSGEPKTLETNTYTVTAMVKNISQREDILMKINGVETDRFQFDKKTGVIKAKVTKLRNGNNRIALQASNEAGITRDNAILIYEPEPVLALKEAPATRPETYEAPVETKVIPPPPPVRKKPSNSKIEGYSRAEITKGQIIKIRSLSFKMNDSTLTESAHTRLDEIYTFLSENEDIVIEIGGHTSGLCDDYFCNILSTARAKEVANYLQRKGIPRKQLSYKGYGKTKPIASNNTTGGRRKNQRVEIKILSTDG